MIDYSKTAGILVHTPSAKPLQAGSNLNVEGINFTIVPISQGGPAGTSLYTAEPDGNMEGLHPWDATYKMMAETKGATFMEPDLWQRVPMPAAGTQTASELGMLGSGDDGGYDEDWHPKDAPSLWHKQDDFSQLESAFNSQNTNPDQGNGERVRIAHFDTGYSPGHPGTPKHVRTDLERNFVESGAPVDKDSLRFGVLENYGHGTATLALLASDMVNLGGKQLRLGGFPEAEVIPIRIARSVVLIKTSAFAQALNYVVDLGSNPANRVHVISMSMGGTASKAWADAVNRAYEAGIVMVTAAGNNIAGISPSELVYPARFRRVLAACGCTYEQMAYSNRGGISEMWGNFGPLNLMGNALAAYTPNVPWARIKSNDFSWAGAGTSSATPQIAAAAALLYARHFQQLQALQPWERVEAIRHLLFSQAERDGKANNPRLQFGNGILRANKAMQAPFPVQSFTKQDRANASFAMLKQLFTNLPADTVSSNQLNAAEMLDTEIQQLITESRDLQQLLLDKEDGDTRTYKELLPNERREFLDTLIAQKNISQTLHTVLQKRRATLLE